MIVFVVQFVKCVSCIARFSYDGSVLFSFDLSLLSKRISISPFVCCQANMIGVCHCFIKYDWEEFSVKNDRILEF